VGHLGLVLKEHLGLPLDGLIVIITIRITIRVQQVGGQAALCYLESFLEELSANLCAKGWASPPKW
jgi:hypothetical protein